MCRRLSARARPPIQPILEGPTTSAPPAVPARAAGLGCCLAWDVVFSSSSSPQQDQCYHEHHEQCPLPTAIEAAATAAFSSPTPPPRAGIPSLLAAGSRTQDKAGRDTMETILEGWEEDWERRPSLLWRIQRTLSSGARRAVEQTLGLNDGYDSEDDEEISEALFEEVGGDMAAARRRNYATLRWRYKHGIDDILETPSPELSRVLACWPRWLQGRGKDGSFLWYEKLGQIDAERLRREGLTTHHGVWARHVGLLCEYVTRCLDPHGAWHDPYNTTPRPKVTIVWDLEGMTAGKWADLAVRKAVRAWGNVLAAHYPGLVVAILVINCPTYPKAALALLQPLSLLPRSLRTKVRVVNNNGGGGLRALGGGGASKGGGAEGLQALTDVIDPATLPVAYPGGENGEAPASAVEWRGLLRWVAQSGEGEEEWKAVEGGE